MTVPGHELVERCCGVACGKTAEGIGEPSLWVDLVELAGLHEQGDYGPVMAALVGACEHGVLAVEGERVD